MTSIHQKILLRRNQKTSENANNNNMNNDQSNIPQPTNPPIINQPKITQLEKNCLQYVELQKNNPPRIEFNNSYFPASYEVYEKTKFQFGFYYSPYPQQNVQTTTKGDKIPRCLGCRSYYNMYNKIISNGKTYICSLCNKENSFPPQYSWNTQQLAQMYYPSYVTMPPDSGFNQAPLQNCYVFLIDICNASYYSQMLFYAVNAIKQILNQQKFDQYSILLYTYDENLHQYNFSSNEAQRIILDTHIEQIPLKCFNNQLASIRTQLFQALDSLQDISKQNTKTKSNFFNAFHYVFEATKDMAPKIFIFQSNQNLITQPMAIQKSTGNQKQQNSQNKKSVLEGLNRQFFYKYASPMLSLNVTFSLFTFSKNWKNLKIFGDIAKLSNSQIFMYQKDSKEDSLKFYYDLYYLLNAPYLNQFKFEVIQSIGWLLTGSYGNLYRHQNTLTFKLGHLQPKKKIVFTAAIQINSSPALPYFCVQIISFYNQNRVRKMNVVTFVKPMTNSINHLYQGFNYTITTALYYKMYLSNLRVQTALSSRTRFIKSISYIYGSLKNQYKNQLPPQSMLFFQGMLAFYKSVHLYIDTINNTNMLDKIVCDRNLLQCTGYDELNTYFTPYLFRISNMSNEKCIISQNEQFIYPQTHELLFSSISSGIFLIDCTTHIYIYLSKNFDAKQLFSLFNIEKITKDLIIQQQNLQQNTKLGIQVANLLYQIRSRKYFQYIPLYVVKCGEGSAQELRLYLYFTNEKYMENKNSNVNFSEFLTLLTQNMGL